ncbi:hypothetical protein C8F01DRAFT_1019471 [Mycena amicta]|nr:hypothetical protein C8F01DRAFT_1019471 [Mycena amicta]
MTTKDASNCLRCSFPSSPLLPSVTETESLRAYLRSNPPSYQDASHFRFRAVVRTGRAELVRYDQRIDDLRTQLNALSAERDTLAEYIDGCRSLFESPIRTLPTEILARILELYTLGEQRPVHEADRISKSYLMNLATVCWRWREIVMGTPALWNRICAKAALWPTSERRLDQYFARLAATLARSGSSPLTLEISAYAAGSPTARSILSRVAEHASRWQSAVFWLDAEAFVSLAAAAGKFAQLRTLALHVGNAFPAPSNLFEVAPRLRDVFFLGNTRNMPLLPWSQITDFKYSTGLFDATDCRRLPLSELPRGSTVQLYAAATPDDNVDSRQTIESLMGSLELYFMMQANTRDDKKTALGSILDNWALPALTRFTLAPRPDVNSIPVWNHAKFAQLSERSGFGARLSSLTIIALISEAELLDTLKGLPNLVDLVISDLPFWDHILVTDNLLRALIILPSSPDPEPTRSAVLVPHLGLLQFSSSLSFADEVLLSVVESRVVQVADTLEHELDYQFTLDLRWMEAAEREPGKEFVTRLRELEKEERLGLVLKSVADSAWHAKFSLV